jgi:fucose 4-O-acetylase-like acetyltransferase
MGQRLDWVDYAKGIGIILVVVGHALTNIKGNDFCNGAAIVIYTFHMPLFFFLSGLFVQKSINKGDKEFIVNKIKVLLYPYFVWSLIEGSIRCFLANKITIQNAVTTYDLLLIPFKPIEHYWFLYALFLCMLMYLVLYKVDKKCFIVLAFSVACYVIANNMPFDIIRSCFNMFMFFVIGSIYNRYNFDVKVHEFNRSLFVLASIAFVFLEIINLTSGPFFSSRFIIAIVGILLILSLSKILCLISGLRLLEYIGRMSMPIYLFHVLFAVTARFFLKKIGVESTTVFIFVESIIGIVMPILFVLALENKVPYLYRWNTKKININN